MPEIPGPSSEILPKRKTRQFRLEASGIREDQLKFYLSTFTTNRGGSRHGLCEVKNCRVQPWKTLKYAFTETHVLKHLSQEVVLGLQFQSNLRYIAIDIDNHGQNGYVEPYIHPCRERMEMVVEAFNGCTPIVIQSSDSKGLHLYWFLDNAVDRENTSKQVADRLHACNIAIKPGYVELPISSCSKLFRLPLGLGGELLDMDSLAPIVTSLSGALDCIADIIQDYTYTSDDLLSSTAHTVNLNLSPAVVKDCGVVPTTLGVVESTPQLLTPQAQQNQTTNTSKRIIHNTTFLPSVGINKNAEYIKVAQRALEYGIEEKSTRQCIVQALVPYLIYHTEMNKSEIISYIWKWLEEKHNNNSTDYSAGKFDIIRNEIEFLVNNFTNGYRKTIARASLTEKEVNFIFDLDARLNTQIWIAEFYRGAKLMLTKDHKTRIELSHIWFRSLWSCSRITATNRIKQMIDLGIVTIEKRHLKNSHPRTYSVSGVTNQEGRYRSYSEGILDLYSREQLSQKYSNYQLRRIIRLNGMEQVKNTEGDHQRTTYLPDEVLDSSRITSTTTTSNTIHKEYKMKRLLTEQEVSELTGRAVKTLQQDRCKSCGIPYIKMGKSVRYDMNDIENFIDSHRVTYSDESFRKPAWVSHP
ncbi:helix-turn-helix domain-containing protein [bacterium]|nr:helix-turn-helix domain-containing protein [bacterium]